MKEPNVPQIITHIDTYSIAFIGLDFFLPFLINTKN